ncbi:2828_t:CDS:2 [Ambispora leptoticha]|uniref:2828_t:CDS:1 n=1 Tax=Ambispora leptoticha TaxID=144679 RepID=A0A9N9ELB4_9GLOM|nr:2828_t:CDS:2 [Ambispora leptoticha]
MVSLGVGIFLVGRKIAKSAKNSENKEQKVQNEKEIEKVQTKLQQAKSQLAAENNPVEKQKLQTEIDNLNQQLTKLKKGNNPTTPPIQNPPTNKTHRKLTVRCNGAVGGKREYINLSNYQERILIDPKNKIFSSDNALYIKDSQYAISFNEEDAEKKGNNFIFDENNNSFQLTPVNIPSPQPNSDQVEMEIKFISAVEDDPGQTPTPPGNNNPPPSKKKITLQLGYTHSSGVGHYVFMEGKEENGSFVTKENSKKIYISQTNTAVNKFLKKNSQYKISFELDAVSESIFQTTSLLFLNEDDTIEVVEA